VEPLDPTTTFLALDPGGEARRIPVGPTFWEDVVAGRVPDMDGLTISAYDYTESWSWERHPAGDEVVVQLSGSTTFVLEVDGGEQRVTLGGGDAVVVPAGVWHRAEVLEPGRVLHVTPGRGTEHRAG
jgi:mannose-6-phosphate isomerase-like protein (cupin superfamily)